MSTVCYNSCRYKELVAVALEELETTRELKRKEVCLVITAILLRL